MEKIIFVGFMLFLTNLTALAEQEIGELESKEENNKRPTQVQTSEELQNCL